LTLGWGGTGLRFKAALRFLSFLSLCKSFDGLRVRLDIVVLHVTVPGDALGNSRHPGDAVRSGQQPIQPPDHAKGGRVMLENRLRRRADPARSALDFLSGLLIVRRSAPGARHPGHCH
jgi:hypothetical protein